MKKNILALTALSLALLASCASVEENSSNSNNDDQTSNSTNGQSVSIDGEYTNNQFSFEEESYPNIEDDYSSQTEETFSEGEEIDVSTFEDGEAKTINTGGTYILSGSNSNARIVIKTSDEIKLILNGVNLTSLTDSPLEIQKASSVTIHVAAKTKNYFADSEANTLEAAILVKKVPLAIEGEGYLYVSGNGLATDDIDSGVAIQDAKGVSITNTHVLVTSSNSHAIKAKLGFTATNAKLSLISSKDAIHTGSDTDDDGNVTDIGNVTITNSLFACKTKGDGIDSEGEITINDSTTHIETEGTFILYEKANDTDGTLYEDSRYIKNGTSYKKIASDDMERYSTRYYLEQKCKGIKSEGAIKISGGTHYLYTTDDCVASDTSIDILAADYTFYTLDQAINSDQALNFGEESRNENTSSFIVRIYHSYEGIQGGNINFYDGYTYIVSEDDGINATSDTDGYSISMNFHEYSTVWINAEGDGIDSNSNVTMDGGNLYVFGPTSGGNSSLDFDGSFTYTGGTILAFGQQGMVQTPNTNSINVLSYNLSSYSANTIITVSSDEYEWSVILPKSYSQLNVIVGSSNISSGSTYTLYENPTTNVTYTNGVYVGSKSSSGSSSISITAAKGLSTYGGSSQGGQGGPGGNGGQGGPGGGAGGPGGR